MPIVSFIYSNVKFTKDSFEFSEDIRLRTATDDEIVTLEKHLQALEVPPYVRKGVYLDHKQVKSKNRTKYLPQNNPKIYVIEDSSLDSNINIRNFELIAQLSKPKLLLGLSLVEIGGTYGNLYHQLNEIAILDSEFGKEKRLVKVKELENLKKYYSLISLSENYQQADYALKLFFDSKSLGLSSPLLTLSLFSIIESLIAHKPKLAESLDSINSQIKNKLNLLSKMFHHPVDVNSYFQNMAFDKVLGRLYGLRSDIAHGNKYDFKKTYQCLKDIKNVNDFLEESVRELIKLALDKTSLILDLKEC